MISNEQLKEWVDRIIKFGTKLIDKDKLKKALFGNGRYNHFSMMFYENAGYPDNLGFVLGVNDGVIFEMDGMMFGYSFTTPELVWLVNCNKFKITLDGDNHINEDDFCGRVFAVKSIENIKHNKTKLFLIKNMDKVMLAIPSDFIPLNIFSDSSGKFAVMNLWDFYECMGMMD